MNSLFTAVQQFIARWRQRFLPQEPKVRAHVTVKGRIFDGSFHVYAEGQARAYRLTGWMKLRDGLLPSAFLEMEVEGPDPKVKDYIMDLRKGNKDSHVTLVTVEWKQAGHPPYSDFQRLL